MDAAAIRGNIVFEKYMRLPAIIQILVNDDSPHTSYFKRKRIEVLYYWPQEKIFGPRAEIESYNDMICAADDVYFFITKMNNKYKELIKLSLSLGRKTYLNYIKENNE